MPVRARQSVAERNGSVLASGEIRASRQTAPCGPENGFHRLLAAKMLEWPDIEADVRQGTVRDAILHAVGANAVHGIRRTNQCKRNAVLTLLRDPEWSAKGSGWIAEKCAVTTRFVRKLIGEAPPSRNRSEIEVSRGGTTYTMDMSNIGRPAPEFLNNEATWHQPGAYAPAAEPEPDPTWTQTDIEDFTGRPDPPPPVLRFPPEHASPAGKIRWLVEELDRSLKLPPLQAARATTGDMAAYVRTARRVAGWLTDLSEIVEDAQVS